MSVSRTLHQHRVPFLSMIAVAAAVLAGCGGSSAPSASSTASGGSTAGSSSGKGPIVIGTSLSLTGDFSADGQAFKNGYEFWASQVNAHGGLLGRQVQIKILNDNSSPSQVVTNYQTLINTDHVALTLGPFSSLLTAPAASVAHRYGFAL